MPFSHDDELTTPIYHCVRIDGIDGGSIRAEQSASAYHPISFFHCPPSFPNSRNAASHTIDTRVSVMGVPSRLTPSRAMTGSNTERQVFIFGPIRAEGFRKHSVALDSTVRVSKQDRV
ncbi:hypothetical protein EI94DRAFT_1737684 [Lactarius quietus]|nr:hypothetical protein EI94DRAFT_1737684 [Lactarius quietus]